MTTHSSVLACRIPGMEEPGGLPSMGLLRVGHDWCDLTAAAAAEAAAPPGRPQVHMACSSILPKGPMAIYSRNHTLGKEEYPDITKAVGQSVQVNTATQRLEVSLRLPIWVGAYWGQVLNWVLFQDWGRRWAPRLNSWCLSSKVVLAWGCVFTQTFQAQS